MTSRPQTPSEAPLPGAVPSWPEQVAEALADPADDHSPLPFPAQVPFTAVHHWHAGAVADLIAETVARHGGDPAPHDTLRALHVRAAAGETIGEDIWSAALEPALRELYRLAYPTARVHARASAAASSFARTRGWSEDEAERYGETYAGMNTEASARVHADANAIANSAAHAAAFATADAEAYARAWPGALVRAWIVAFAGPDESDGPSASWARDLLREGLADALRQAAP